VVYCFWNIKLLELWFGQFVFLNHRQADDSVLSKAHSFYFCHFHHHNLEHFLRIAEELYSKQELSYCTWIEQNMAFKFLIFLWPIMNLWYQLFGKSIPSYWADLPRTNYWSLNKIPTKFESKYRRTYRTIRFVWTNSTSSRLEVVQQFWIFYLKFVLIVHKSSTIYLISCNVLMIIIACVLPAGNLNYAS